MCLQVAFLLITRVTTWLRLAARQLLSHAVLACGADVDLLLEQVADGRAAERDAHQLECVHCQAAIGELTFLWGPVTELVGRAVPAPPGLAAAVMRQIRTLYRSNTRLSR
jgi:hypothetical protein